MKKLITYFLFYVVFITPSMADWQKFGDDCSNDYCTYINSSARSDNGIVHNIGILDDYSSISSAQMWGLSEVETISFDCDQSRIRFGTNVWYEKRMARGKIVKIFPPNKKWIPIPYNYRKLFAKICTL
ncbi:MAG: hypothetical protein KGQ46_04375 [Hyphomicrobiales bacterium]|nr:hypothetical protein [Hyphomicrobiales bacterium]MDE2116223.1 hypothetical protein [Hyphomicrobiales bacterium]